MAFPGRRVGHVQIVELTPRLNEETSEDTTEIKTNTALSLSPVTSVIVAHTSHLCCLATSPDGSRIATASDKGTLIRVFDTKKGTLISEFRRGMERAEIYRF
jgi:WD40 repeat protein